MRRQRDQADSRLMLLQQKSGDTYDAIIWLRENQHRFRKPIVEPIVLVVSGIQYLLMCMYVHVFTVHVFNALMSVSDMIS